MKNLGSYFVFDSQTPGLTKQSKTLPNINDSEILIQINYCSLCGSDLHTYCGLRKEENPTILGHEIVGTVLAFGSSDSPKDLSGKPITIGDTITWTVFASDPHTAEYQSETPQKNTDLFKYGHRKITETESFHGGLATHIVLKAHTGIRILPKELPLPIAATINCAIATAAGSLRLAMPLQNKVIYISGMGMLGLVAVAMAKELGVSKVIVSDTTPLRLELAKEFGADLTINPLDNNTTILSQQKIDRFIDMSGAPSAMEDGIDHLITNGIAVLIGAVFKQRPIEINAEQVIRKLLQIKGLHNYNYEDFNHATDFIIDNWTKYPFEKLIEKEFQFEETKEAFDYAIQHKPVRTGIIINT
ncbi:zinc-binding dehydrogenase [Sphingobacterium sp. UT-1RO-CII-1]|uniref:zinc-binding dehydrogenase n=1 Tax=Sphingobacterium sp. UT-1RO-CII-1 TaxID=2995225 RepID=UPI00227CEB0C|nr:zinc-binding dehydrogenase [Sphingobacterium sp. UT-1RO-CII-1]MCY4781729.1 zinc-binding dehydrogenase [Sphingobacterium sp. UT-1RO-CII-1]